MYVDYHGQPLSITKRKKIIARLNAVSTKCCNSENFFINVKRDGLQVLKPT